MGGKRREGSEKVREGGKRREGSEKVREGGKRREGSEKVREGEERIPVILKVWPHVTEDSLEQRMNLVFLGTSKHAVNKMGEHL